MPASLARRARRESSRDLARERRSLAEWISGRCYDLLSLALRQAILTGLPQTVDGVTFAPPPDGWRPRRKDAAVVEVHDRCDTFRWAYLLCPWLPFGYCLCRAAGHSSSRFDGGWGSCWSVSTIPYKLRT